MSFQPSNAFEEQFRQFLQEPETQDAIRGDQEKEIKVMKKMDEFESLHELTGQREQLAVALRDGDGGRALVVVVHALNSTAQG